MTNITIEIESDELSARLFNMAFAGTILANLGLDEEKVVEYMEALTDDVVESLLGESNDETDTEPAKETIIEGWAIKHAESAHFYTAKVFPTYADAVDYLSTGLYTARQREFEILEVRKSA